MPPGIIESFPILYHYDQASFPHREDVTTSPLRFTWEYENPRYYSDCTEYSQRNIPVAVLSGGNQVIRHMFSKAAFFNY